MDESILGVWCGSGIWKFIGVLVFVGNYDFEAGVFFLLCNKDVYEWIVFWVCESYFFVYDIVERIDDVGEFIEG